MESPVVNAAPEDDGASPLNHMMAKLVKHAASGQSPINTTPNRKVPKRSRIPTPVVTPSTRKAKRKRLLPDTPLTGFEASPDGYPWSLEEQLQESKQKTKRLLRKSSRTLEGNLHQERKKTLREQPAKEPNKEPNKQLNSCGKNSIPNENKRQKGTCWCRNQEEIAKKMLEKTGVEFHWPGYQYLGPGTKLKKRLGRGDPGINRLDKIAKQHDIDFSKARHLKDRINKLPGRKTKTERIVKKVMQAKVKLGV